MKTLAILGATGSIGTQALDIVQRHPDQFKVKLLTAYARSEALFELVRRFKPEAAGLVAQAQIPEDLKKVKWFFGADCSERGLCETKPDDALAAVVGIAGLSAVLSAIDHCGRVLLANKEALVTGGEMVLNRARARGTVLIPVDSEHSAIFQCLEGAGGNRPTRLILTASGGPLRTLDAGEIARATPDKVLRHPTWRMGKKITVDCASMMNKGLEVIEAHYLFGVPSAQIDVIVHPESIIHSMVAYEDGAVIAQMSMPDMRLAIGYAMGYPERVPYGGAPIDFARLGKVTFEAPDEARFPCLALARAALEAGGNMPTALNGANEQAVSAFLAGQIPFGDIARTVRAVLDATIPTPIDSLDAVYACDRAARALAQDIMANRPNV
ncbi:MAG: 1-deoxy-D-xylulose-5-phosphate reductoisomerase [Clostridia bacterium]